jgi:murein peptide amidase A
MPTLRFLTALVLALPIGHSVDGRAIRPVVLGSAPPAHRLLVVGCIHGNEPAGMPLVRALERSGALAGTEIVVLPTVNPDGCLALGTRQNAHGVDLNRNFPSNWAPIGRRGSFQWSGPRPLSEPETRYAVALVRALHPAVTVWFHQHEDVVRAWGPSRATARRFAALLGGVLPYRDERWPYGTASNWQNHAFPGTASFVVELPSGAVPSSLVARYVRALRELARVGFVR